MKKLILIALLAQFVCSVKAQEVVEMPIAPKISHTISVNTAPVMKRILKIAPDTLKNAPLLMYRFQFGKNAFRFSGTGNRTRDVEGVAEFLDTKTKLDYNFALRLGYEKQKTVNDHFMVSYGLEATWEYLRSDLVVDSGFDVVSISKIQYGIGGGPFLGLTWKFSKELSLYAETGFHFIQGRKVSLTDFEKNPDFNDTKNAANFDRTSFFLPTGLFLQYHF
jgi:hypothetical protein